MLSCLSFRNQIPKESIEIVGCQLKLPQASDKGHKLFTKVVP